GPDGSRSNYIGIDSLAYVPVAAVQTPGERTFRMVPASTEGNGADQLAGANPPGSSADAARGDDESYSPVVVDIGIASDPNSRAVCGLLGDVNFDGRINGNDIQPFIDCEMGGAGPCACNCADLDGGGVSVSDVPLFVAVLLGS